MLKVLDTYKFCGILPNDLGLGKAIQILSIITNVKNKEKIKLEQKIRKV